MKLIGHFIYEIHFKIGLEKPSAIRSSHESNTIVLRMFVLRNVRSVSMCQQFCDAHVRGKTDKVIDAAYLKKTGSHNALPSGVSREISIFTWSSFTTRRIITLMHRCRSRGKTDERRIEIVLIVGGNGVGY